MLGGFEGGAADPPIPPSRAAAPASTLRRDGIVFDCDEKGMLYSAPSRSWLGKPTSGLRPFASRSLESLFCGIMRAPRASNMYNVDRITS